MKAEDVATYLQENPQFFEDHADMIAEIYIPHPHGGRAISISERQILSLRDKSRQLESKLRDIIQFGEENDVISEKVHRLALALLGTADLATAVAAVQFNLREDFSVPHVELRVWRPEDPSHAIGGLPPVSDATREFAAGLATPYCSAHAVVDTAALFGEAAANLRSFAYVPLKQRETIGLIALASEDAHRFYPDMGTMFLTRIGEMAAAAFARHLT